ncbi:viral aspartic protease [Paracoccus sp. Z118]|uniref:viral aspartic protease n=1 Tax=Paracoccus sp. Z118 TaxID=2851017 RepID=UPI001C2C253F|nr:viral aspartic protease [Paracoccus sp. Z118]MBV0892868.1 viral aspartic protease [Paracoccus sp. Z118]
MTLPSRSAVLLLLSLSACGGGGGGPSPGDRPDAVPVPDGPFEAYQANHNGFSRVRMNYATAADAAVLAGFEDSDPADPVGYRNLIAQNEALYEGNMVIEVIAEVDTDNGDKAKRLLRLTADQAPFENVRNGRLVEASGKYHFRGQSLAWVTIDSGPLLSGRHDRGLESLVLDFDAGTANIDIRTEVSRNSEVEIGLKAAGLPFDVVSGAYGGGVTINVNNPDVTEAYSIDGHLRGNVGGRPGYRNDVHGLTTSGLYRASGSDGGTAVTVDGVFMGADPNVLP